MNKLFIRMQDSARYLILLTRKNNIVGLIFLLMLAFVFLTRPQETAIQADNNNLDINIEEPLAPVVTAAQAQATKSQNSIRIQWDKPIENPQFWIDNRTIRNNEVYCELDFCTITWEEAADNLLTIWLGEQGEVLRKEFKFE